MQKMQIYEYKGTPIEFEIIDGHVMANATLMAKANGKDMSSIFRTQSWVDFEMAVIDYTGLNSVDLRNSKVGVNGATWIHEELVVEFARRLDSRFSLWCNRTIAELSKQGVVAIQPLSQIQILQHSVNLLVEHEKRIGDIELKQVQTSLKVDELEAKVTNRPSYFSIMGYAVLEKQTVGNEKAKKLGMIARKMCIDKGVEIEKIEDPRFGKVNTYPLEILREVFRQAA